MGGKKMFPADLRTEFPFYHNTVWGPLLLILAQESASKDTGRGRSCRALSQQSTHTV